MTVATLALGLACSGAGTSGGSAHKSRQKARAADTKDEVDDPSTPSPPPPPEILELQKAVGGSLSFASVPPGEYQADYRFGAARFITMEHSISESIRGDATLKIADNGTVSLCLHWNEHSRGSVSKYASDDGKHHVNESDHEQWFSARGTWVRDALGSQTQLTLTEHYLRGCEARETESFFTPPEPTGMTCRVFEGAEKLQGWFVGCRLNDAKGRQFEGVGMMLVGSPRDGSWKLRHPLDMRGEEPIPETALPWLILGNPPGFEIESDDPRRGQMKLSFEAKK